ncbi:MAG: hypothetical protein OXC11_11730 [Rhodospirillales bacterium]|nr:hypothetical protein [Alphaproteobacteria bacterium]MCY4431044.1 hypothetical protein [Rhodospirillales bacterium]
MSASGDPLLHAILPETFAGDALAPTAADFEAAVDTAIGYQAIDVETDDNGYDGGGLIRAVSLDHVLLILGLPARCYPLEQPARLKAFVEKQQIYVHEQFESMLGNTTLAAWRTAVVDGNRWHLHYTARSTGAFSFHAHPAYYPAVLPPKPAAIRYFLRRHVFQLGQ